MPTCRAANLAGDAGQPFFGLIFDSRVVVPDGPNPASDPGYLSRQPRWQPSLGASGGDYQITDFLRFAGVDPVSRGQWF